jgi:hypothetical protein
MALKDTMKRMGELIEKLAHDLKKSATGNKAAAQRVRTGSIKLSKVAKTFRKESVKAARSGGLKKKKPAKKAKKKATKRKTTAKKPARKVARKKVAKKATKKRTRRKAARR